MSLRTLAIGAVIVTAFLAVRPLYASERRPDDPAVSAVHPILAASLERLASESASWRDAMRAIAPTGRKAVVVTPDDVTGFDSQTLAQALALADHESRVETVIVVVNLALLQRLSRLPVEAMQFKDDLDRIVAHEVFGHAVPYLLAGHLAGECADPAAGQRVTDACAIKRENQIRKELQLGRRLDYGRESLTLARRYER
jgi:hypothetical protein